MKLPILTSFIVRTTAVLMASMFACNVFAISSNDSSNVKDYKLKPKKGKILKHSDISIAIRNRYKGVRPRIAKRKLSGNHNCYDVKFIYKSQLKRVSFNCTSTQLVMRASK